MNAIILSIGDELILGQIIDSNSAWISQQLASIGCAARAHVTVGDDQRAIENVIRESIGKCDLLIISGGIGPTPDDLTRQALAEVMHVPLELNQTWLAEMRRFFEQRGREMPEMNKIQAMIPKGAAMIFNSCGTAAGIDAYLSDDCRVVVMPGVPAEMKKMFESSVRPTLVSTAGGSIILSRTLHTFGLGESAIAQKLGELMRRDRNPSVGTTVSQGIVSLRINARFPSEDQARRELNDVENACRRALGDLIFGKDDESLSLVVARQLLWKHSTVTTAESCTGGLLAKMFTDISGSSDYFKMGFITYSNEAKYERLGVPMDLIKIHGAVSEPVVSAMARNARRLAKADFALSISGIAGPSGGSPAKPVGTVCIALAKPTASTGPSSPKSAVGPEKFAQSDVLARTFAFPGDRDWVRDRAAKMALSMLRFQLLECPLPF